MVRLLHGDCLALLETLPEGSVHCCITSPPYFAVRDYGIPPTAWPEVTYTPMTGCAPITVPAMDCCLGLEPTLEAFIAHLVLVFRGVRRVLRRDGTLWMNLGDTYAGSGRGGSPTEASSTLEGGQANQRASMVKRDRNDVSSSQRRHAKDGRGPLAGLKTKDLMMAPARAALALQADGWYLRQDVIWGKANPMPESAKDRCTKAHEYIYLLSKTPRYYFDAVAIAEPASPYTNARTARRKVPGGWDTGDGGHRGMLGRYDGTGVKAKESAPGSRQNESFSRAISGEVLATRNKRSVWITTTEPFAEAHFATFPPSLIEPAVLASTSERGCCPACGAPWLRVAERDPTSQVETTGWEQGCKCTTAEPVPCTVLDVFGGAGTTGLVADRLHRDAILMELKPEWVELQRRRITGDAPLFAEIEG